MIDTSGRVVFSSQDIYTPSGTLTRVSGAANKFAGHGRLTDVIDVIRTVGATQHNAHHGYSLSLVTSDVAPDVRVGYDQGFGCRNARQA